ncbi:MAG: DMT family transporter [Chloroflexota bacterium]|nr:MAG: DMT family transporter [Chloroflexota bacterium]
MQTSKRLPIIQALLAAILFGASAPLSKLLLNEIDPIVLAALLYIGSGLSATVIQSIQRLVTGNRPVEAQLKRADLPWMAGAILTGGVLAPILLMVSLDKTPAATASLLLNFETVATALVAGLVFRESIGRSVWMAVGLVTLASVVLSWNGGSWGFSVGALGVLGACILWGLDNNLTRNVSAKDPLAIVMLKGFGAGGFSLLLALLLGRSLPGALVVVLSLLVGGFCYGLSIALFVLALRSLGAARTGTLYASAPFVGAALSLAVFRDGLNVQLILSLPLMAGGPLLLLRENHTHSHQHDTLEHEHCHTHDDHHGDHHARESDSEPGSHTHWHRHEPVSHAHDHTPDLHHRHGHEDMVSD